MHIDIICGSCLLPQDASIDRRKRMEGGCCTRYSGGLTRASRGYRGKVRRASLASISATGVLPMQRAARRPRTFTHISNPKS